MTNTQLTVAIATTAKRLIQLDTTRLPVLSGVVYGIFVQGAADLSLPRLQRADITLTATEGTGAARNRNAALLTVSSPLLLFADDDLHFSPEGLTALIARFAALPDMDFLCCRISDEAGNPRKRYSPDGASVRWWNCAKVGTPELALRPAAFRAKALAFDPRFGAGMPDCLGDEYIFLCDALRAGLNGQHAALTLASHPAESSGTRENEATMEIRRRVFHRAVGRWRSLPVWWAFKLRRGWRS